MRRRDFLHILTAGLVAPAGLIACGGPSRPTQATGKRVVVIGGGIAGLIAARDLQRAGHTAIVLEANTRPGGRLRTRREGGVIFDEGASWIHGPSGNPLTTLAAEAGATTFLTPDDSVAVYNATGQAYTDQALESAESTFNALLDDVEEAGQASKSVQQVLQALAPQRFSDPLWQYMLSAYLEFNSGAALNRLSSLYFQNDSEFGGADRIITNGFDTVATFLASNLDVRSGHRVFKITREGNLVRVFTSVRSFEADAAIVAVPLGILKRGEITFEPGLSADKQGAINRVGMGVVNKCLMIWDTPFWDTDLQYIGTTGPRPGLFNYFLNVRTFSASNALMTFALGPEAAPFEQMSDADATAFVMQKLRAIYGDSVPAPTRIMRTAWGSDGFTHGAYSFAAVGSTPADFGHLAATEDQRIAFAGEHTSLDYRGTVHGALLSGQRAVQALTPVLA